jgi:uncharacterized protein DUF4402
MTKRFGTFINKAGNGLNESETDMIARCFKRRLFAGIVLFWVAVLILPAQTVNGASATLQANVTINGQAVEIISSTMLSFGKYKSDDDDDGTVVVTTANSRVFTGGVKAGKGGGPGLNFNRAEFVINGPADTSYTITLPTGISFDEFNSNDGTPTGRQLDVINLKSLSITVGAETTTGMTDSNGEDTIYVGGTLMVPAIAEGDDDDQIRISYGVVPLGIQN